jgi:hypothetical protein
MQELVAEGGDKILFEDHLDGIGKRLAFVVRGQGGKTDHSSQPEDQTKDFETRERRPSRKADVGIMARISDYLPSIGFIWPMVSAQDHGETAPLHEIDAAWNNTSKHVQSETVMGETHVVMQSRC